MTAPRSFREAFTEDPADVKDRARIVGERDSARDWAVVLENRIEKALYLLDHPPSSYRLGAHVAAALTGGGDE